MEALNNANSAGRVIGLASVEPVATRVDIDYMLYKRQDQFNLFLLALMELQADKEMNNKLSYYQIAGIHGMPIQTWDGVPFGGKTSVGIESGQFDSGYCPHGRGTFPTWHRPYLALLEQSLYQRMSVIAGAYAEKYRRTYQNAVKGFRLPYWDYFRPRGGQVTFGGIIQGSKETTFPWDFRLPDIFTRREVMVRITPDNTLVSRPNPLYSYEFPKIQRDANFRKLWTIRSPDDFGRMQEWNYWPDAGRSTRYPRSRHPQGPTGELNDALNTQREGNNELVCYMMLDRAYGKFSVIVSNEFTPGQGASGSVEGIHNSYHGLLGGDGGEMSVTTVAAFDPVFWIHHCQIDRLFAIWQALHPREWYTNQRFETADLLPFRYQGSKQQYWYSNNCKDTRDFGYVYPDTDFSSPREVEDYFRAGYLWQIRSTRNPNPKCPDSMLPWPVRDAQVFQYGGIKTASLVAQDVAFSSMTTAQNFAARMVPSSLGGEEDDATAQEATTVKPSAEAAPQRVFNSLADSGLSVAAPDEIDETKIQRRWFIDNMVERLALNGTFTIYYFIGPVDDSDVHSYTRNPTLCGISHNFAAPIEACDNCGDQALTGHKVTDTNAITPMLLDYIAVGQLADLTPENVGPFLVKNMKWRIVTGAGVRVDPRGVAGLRVGVSSKLVNVETGDVTYQDHPDIVAEILAHAS